MYVYSLLKGIISLWKDIIRANLKNCELYNIRHAQYDKAQVITECNVNLNGRQSYIALQSKTK